MKKINWKFILNNKGFFDLVVPILVGSLAGAGIAEGIGAMSKTPKAPGAPDLPDPNKANKDGAATVASQRQAMLSSGGQTDQTGGLGVLTGADVSTSSLIGG